MTYCWKLTQASDMKILPMKAQNRILSPPEASTAPAQQLRVRLCPHHQAEVQGLPFSASSWSSPWPAITWDAVGPGLLLPQQGGARDGSWGREGSARGLSLLLCVFLTHFPLLPTKARFLRLISEAVGDTHVNPVL